MNIFVAFVTNIRYDARMSNFGQEIHLIGPRDGDKECDDNVKAKSLSALVSVFL